MGGHRQSLQSLNRIVEPGKNRGKTSIMGDKYQETTGIRELVSDR